MKSYTLTTLWTKTGDGQPHQRKRSVSVEVPVEGDTTEIEDALLSLPWTPDANYGELRTVSLPDSLDALTDEVVLETAIPQLRWEIEGWVHAKAEEKEAAQAKRRVVLEKWLDGGETDTPWGVNGKRVGEVRSERHPSYSRDVMHYSLSDEALGWLEGHDSLRARVETHLELLNLNADRKTRIGLDVADDKRDEARTEQEAKDAAKQTSADARAAEIRVWAAEHGSTRLQDQIEMGLSGWPLYLHERLQSEFGDRAELDNDGETGTALVNPTPAQLDFARQIAILAVERGLRADVNTAFVRIAIVPITFEADVDEDGYCDGVPEMRIYVTFDGYRPGSEAFAVKTIRFVCEES